MSTYLRVLIIEDSEEETAVLINELKGAGYEPTYKRVQTPKALAELLDQEQWDVIIVKHNTTQLSELEALEIMHSREQDIAFVVVSDEVCDSSSLRAIKSGADNYVSTDDLSTLPHSISRAMQDRQAHQENKRLENALLFLSQRSWTATGEEDFLSSLARCLARTVDADYAFIGRLTEDKDNIEIVALYAMGELQPSTIYKLRHTPCENVVGRLLCTYPQDVQKLFPKDELLKEMEAESYVGVPLWDSRGEPIGIASILSKKPLSNMRLAEALLQLVAARAASELERRQFEDALRESEEKFRKLAENAEAIIGILQGDGFVYANRYASELTGYTREELVSMGVVNLIHPDFRDLMLKRMQQRMQGEPVPTHYEFKLLTKDGRTVWLDYSAARIELKGEPAIVGVAYDITNRKKTEEELLQTTHMLQLVLDTIPTRVFWKDLDGVFLGCNSLVATDAGVSSTAEIIGKTDFDMPWKDTEAAKYRADDAEVIETGKPKINIEETQHTADGRILWLLTSKIPLKDDAENIIGVLVTWQDITERREAEQALQESEAKFRLLAENSTDMISRHTLDGVYLYASPACRTVSGYEPEDMIGHSAFEFIHPDDQQMVDAARESIVDESKQVEIATFRARHKDGTYRWIETTFRSIRDDQTGQIAELQASSRDVTARKMAEEAVKASENKYRLLFENMTAGFALHEMIYDEDGHPVNYRYLEVNPAFEKLTGVPAWAIVGKTIKDVMPNTEQYWIDIFGKVALTGEPVAYENYAAEIGKHFDTWVFCPRKDQFAVVFTDITDRKRAEEALRDSEEKFRLVAQIAPAGIYLTDPQGKCRYANERWLDMAGLTFEQAMGDGWIKGIHPDDRQMVFDNWNKLVDSEGRWGLEYRFQDGNGKITQVYGLATPQYDSQGNVTGYIGVNIDVTDRKQAEEHILQINRTLRVLSEVNQALIRTTVEEDLLQTVCRIAVEVGGYKMAWIGYLEYDENRTIRPVAVAGDDNGYLASIKVEWSESEYGKGPAGTAVRTRKPCAIGTVSEDPSFQPWKEEAIKRGYKSAVSVPLITGDQVLGCMTLYSDATDTFDEEESNLLMELAGDLAYGIASIRTREERDRAEQQALEYSRSMTVILESMTDAFVSLDDNFQFIYINNAAETYWGVNREKLVGRSIFEAFPGLSDSDFGWAIPRSLRERIPVTVESLDPSVGRWLEAHIYPSETGVSVYFRDITDRRMAEEHKREFYRRTILAATQGKLVVTDREDIARIAGMPLGSWSLSYENELGAVRHAIGQICHAEGLDESTTYDMLLCVGEAGTNAIKHAGGGTVSLHRVPDGLMVVVSDRGTGIDALVLPEATMRLGYSTAGSLGMGYKAIISLADRVYLSTGPSGTTVAFTMKLHREAPVPDIANLPDTW